MMDINRRDSDEQSNSERKQQHVCPYCQKVFIKIEDLNLHVLTKHTGSYSLHRAPHNDNKDAHASTSG
jgi:hypothetical protein